MSNPEKNIKLLQITGYVSGLFTVFIAIIVIMAYVQVETIKPLENPSLVSLREQYDNDPNNEDLKEQVRTLDLMARKAFFAARWQIETGTYLLLAGALIFIISQRMLLSTRKKIPDIPEAEYDLIGLKRKSRLALIVSFGILTLLAFVASFLLRIKLPDPLRVPDEAIVEEVSTIVKEQAPRAPITQQDAAPEPETEIADDQQEPVAAEEQVAETSIKPTEGIDQQYPFFRGPGSCGKVAGQEYPVRWDGTTGQNIEWKVKVPKIGNSSPVIWGERIFLTGAEGDETVIMCFNKTSGELMWTASATEVPGEPDTPPATTEDTGLAAPTAATNGSVVCAIFATGSILCCDFNGERIWAKNIGVPQNPYGHASSLIIHENKLLVQYDHMGKKSLMAFDVNSGNLIWETIRPVETSWASPVITEFNGIIQVILVADPYVISYDVNTGRELWAVECTSGEVGPSVGVNSKYVYAVNEYAVLAAINPAEPASVVWADDEYTTNVSSPVATEELVFLLTSWGGVACYNAETGDIVWEHEFEYGFYASPIVAGNNVYMLDQGGLMHVVKAESEFQLVADSPIGERTVCTPAFSERKIYIRSVEHLYCISE